MFTERTALQNRLYSLDEKERIFTKEINRERNDIYDRLRELDARGTLVLGEPISIGEIEESSTERTENVEDLQSASVEEIVMEEEKEEAPIEEVQEKEKESNQQAALGTSDAKEYIVEILKEADSAINIKMIRNRLEELNIHVNKLSNVMWYLSRKTDLVKNPSRGLYEYNKYAKTDDEEV